MVEEKVAPTLPYEGRLIYLKDFYPPLILN